MLSKIKRHHIILLFLLGLISVVGIIIWKDDQSEGQKLIIRPFNQKSDLVPLSTLINANKFMLSENNNFPTEKFLLWRAPNFDPARKGQAHIDVIEVDGVPAGFVSFYRKSTSAGYVWLLAVDKHFRGQGLGQKLMEHALGQLKQQGARFVTLTTRTINTQALKLYLKLGFVEKSRDEERGIVFLTKENL
ncbi:MAG: GNAT family N-acetyltransferase [Myxococcales bacterium]|nr:GNAT family N-acetyltransferase [Myxococcales bacterium]USN51589.1 MAG: GNAT family N-acetyltransferase [Myxococcales bacterium]